VKLTLENTDVVAEHDILVGGASTPRHRKAEDATQADIEEGEGHIG
jgi:hypothetical protein